MRSDQCILGLTGSIGSGKSTVAKVFLSMGIPVYFSDHKAKQLYWKDSVKEKVKQLFGDEVFSGHQIDVNALARVAFANSDKLNKLNQIIHPLVAEDFDQWTEQQNTKAVIQESALVFEAGLKDRFDFVITVSAPMDLRIQRVMLRDQLSKDQVMKRMVHQWPDQEKVKRADFVIVNDGKQLLVPQILQLMSSLSL
ncbi:MAG: dephospho-CoA kinase [Bacteroidales bacterium]